MRLKHKIKKFMAIVVSGLLVLSGLPFSASAASTGFRWWTENNLVKVLPVSEKTDTSEEKVSIDMAKNEFEAAQIVLKDSEKFTINSVELSDLTGDKGKIAKENLKANFVEYMTLKYNSVSWWTEVEYKSYIDSYGNVFPEKLLNDESIDVKANTAQSIWFTAYTPKDVLAGTYNGNVKVNTSKGDIEVPVSVIVHDVTVPDPADGEYENILWTGTAGWTGEDGHGTGDGVADPVLDFYKGLEKYSSQWWELMKNFAQQMREDRVTSYWVPTTHLLLDGGSTVDADGTVHFNWSKFDEVIQFFLDNGSFNVLEGSHFLYGGGVDGNTGYSVYALYRDNATGETKKGNIPFEEAYTEKYAKQFFTALSRHLKEKGWDKMWLQYLGDEPTNDTFTKQWIKAREEWMRPVAPDMKVHVAVNNMTVAKELAGHVDVWVPILNIQDQNMKYFNDRKDNYNEDVLNYICSGNPCQWYMNRHIDMPYAPMRLLGWYNYKMGLSGTLNWAYNFWWNDNATTANPGDNGIVYPDVEKNKLIGSVRGASLRDGAEEYELLKMIDKKDSKLAQSMVKTILPEESGNSQYVVDPEKILSVRIDMLKMLSGEEIDMSKYPTEHKMGVSSQASSINVDGKLDEREWFGTTTLNRVVVGSSATISADFATTWDSENFYIGLKVTDLSKKITDFTNSSMTFYISPENNRSLSYSKKDFQIQVFNKGTVIKAGAAGYGNNDNIELDKINVKSVYDTEGYTMEIAMPWKQIGIEPAAGTHIGFDIMAFDNNDAGCVLSWSGDVNDWQSPYNFGELVLKGEDNTKTMVTPKATRIDFDGLLNENVWKSTQPLEKVIVGDKATIVADFGTAWDSSNLYIGLKVKDPEGKNRDFTKDSMTFYIAPKNYRGTPYSNDDFQIQVFDCGDTIKSGAAGVGKNDYIDCSKIKVKSNYTIKGYTMEIAIPWSEMNIVPRDNYKVGFDIMAFDGSGPEEVDLYSASLQRNVPIISKKR